MPTAVNRTALPLVAGNRATALGATGPGTGATSAVSVRSRGGEPVLVTPPVRHSFNAHGARPGA